MHTAQNVNNSKDFKARAEKLEAMTSSLKSMQSLPPAGTRLMLAILPEKMPILAAGGVDADQNRLQAGICRIVYAGSVSPWLLEAADGTRSEVLVRNREMAPRQPCETITLARSPSHCAALTE